MTTLHPPRKILLNPGPATTTDRVKHALVVADVCPRERVFGDMVQRVREKLVRVPAGAQDYTAVLLGGSGTAAMEACVASVVPPEGRLLVAANGAYGERAIKIAAAYGIPHTPLRLPWTEPLDVDAVRHAIDATPGTTHLFFVHHETTTGLLNPLEQLSALCHARGIVSVVDAVSSYAGLPLDLARSGADFLFSSSNKCVQGFAGLGFVLARKSALLATERLARRNVYLNLFDNWAHQDSGGQFLFTPPVQIVYALHEALDEFFEEGQAGRTARYFACYDVLIEGMEALGMELLIPKPAHSKLLTTYLEPKRPGYGFEAMHDYLFERDVTIYPGKLGNQETFRIANIGAIGPDDMRLYLRHTREYLATLG